MGCLGEGPKLGKGGSRVILGEGTTMGKIEGQRDKMWCLVRPLFVCVSVHEVTRGKRLRGSAAG